LSVYVIAGAGTDIGKTYVTTLLLRRLKGQGRQVMALKPVVSGVPAIDHPDFTSSDTARLLLAQDLAITGETVASCSPWRFKAPLSPDMAAAAEGETLSLGVVLDWCREQIKAAPAGSIVLIEGVGGIMSPMTSDALNLDLIKALGCRVLLVTGTYLGALTHALTALETLKAHDVFVEALVLNESAGSGVDFFETLATLRRYVTGAPIVSLRRDRSDINLGLN
jgi:dethiobiotin synthetase